MNVAKIVFSINIFKEIIMKKTYLALALIFVLAFAVNSFAIPAGFGSHFSSWLSANGYGSAFPEGGFGGK